MTGQPLGTAGFVDACGLTCDIIGAFFLAQSLVLRRKKDVTLEVGTYFGLNVFALRSAAFSTVDARAGLVFLIAGFTGQFLGASDIFPSGSAHYWWAILLGAGVLFALAFVLLKRIGRWYCRRLAARTAVDGISEALSHFDKGEMSDLSGSCRAFGMVLALPRELDETDETYLRRLGAFAETIKTDR